MKRLRSRIRQTLSSRISLTVVCAIGLLLLLAVFFVLRFSYKAMREDAMQNANETLEYTLQHIDNVLLSVEQSAGNIYWDLLNHVDEPERMHTYCRQLLQNNPYVAGCAIAMAPGYFPGRDSLFMAYYYRDGLSDDAAILSSQSFANCSYHEQDWYTRPMRTGTPSWIDPMKEASSSNESVTTFSLPIFDAEGRVVGVLGADVSTVLLSDIIQRAKPTPHSYAMLMGQSQSFVVYPDSSKLLHQGLIPMLDEHADTTVKQALKLMAEGQTGHLRVRFDEGGYSYVFFKPFVRKPVPGRSDNELNWSSAVVMSEDDIFGGFTRMCTIVILVAIAGLLVLWLLCRFIMNRQLRPLRMLTQSAQLISEGQYVETIAESRHVDEVGTLQNHFRQMQQALSTHIGELNRLTSALREDGDELERAYKQAKEAERMKTAVLHNMSSQMLRPANAIADGVEALSTRFSDMNQEEVETLVNQIEQQGQEATQLLDQLLSASREIPESH